MEQTQTPIVDLSELGFNPVKMEDLGLTDEQKQTLATNNPERGDLDEDG